MTVAYLDTSSLVKLYVREAGSDTVAALMQTAAAAATSVVAYPEARAAFSRRYREGGFDAGGFRRLKKGFDRDWPHYAVVPMTMELAKTAGEMTEKYHLRGFDAIHLASALNLQSELGQPLLFSCFDHHLNQAAQEAGLRIA